MKFLFQKLKYLKGKTQRFENGNGVRGIGGQFEDSRVKFVERARPRGGSEGAGFRGGRQLLCHRMISQSGRERGH